MERKLKMFTDVKRTRFVLFYVPEMFHCRHPLKCFPFFLHTLEFMSSLLIKPRSDSLSAAWPAAMFALRSKMDIALYLILKTGRAERKDWCQGTGIATGQRSWSQPRADTHRTLSKR